MNQLKHPAPTPIAPEDYEEFRTLRILATRLCDDEEDMYPDDLEVPEWTSVEVPAHLDDATAAIAALGAFHSTVPVKRLWDFEFTVHDEDEEEMKPNYYLNVYDTAEKYGATVL